MCRRRRRRFEIILRYCEVEVHGVAQNEQGNPMDVNGNGGGGGIDIQINDGGCGGGGEKEGEEEGSGEGTAAVNDGDEDSTTCITAAEDGKRSIMNRLRWKSGGSGGAKVRLQTVQNLL